MQFAPEAQILILNATILLVAYLGIYPSLKEKTLNRIMTIDLVLTCLALLVAGRLFWGLGTPFNMLFFNANWAVFTLVTLFTMEIPLFVWLCRKYDISLFDESD